MVKETKLTRSLEDYLEAILYLEKKNRVARVKDIANHLGVQMPSVTGALKNLRKRGFINYEKNSFISLTQEGLALAGSIQSRHDVISRFLEKALFMPAGKAADEACKIEHVISKETAERLQNLTDFVENEILNPENPHLKEKLENKITPSNKHSS